MPIKDHEISSECDCSYDTSRGCVCPVRYRLWPDREEVRSARCSSETGDCGYSGSVTSIQEATPGHARMVIHRVKYRGVYKCPSCESQVIMEHHEMCNLCGTDIEWVELRK